VATGTVRGRVLRVTLRQGRTSLPGIVTLRLQASLNRRVTVRIPA
jgi:hypothetical protein